jgi:hypothetical protein
MFMKNLFVLALFAVAFGTAQAQEAGRANAIKLNPLSLAVVTGNVSYERAIGANTSLQLGGFYTSVGISSLKYTGFGLTPEFRLYFAGAKEALNGVYVAPFVRYQSFTLANNEEGYESKAGMSSIGGGATIGWQKMWGSGFVLDLFAGPSYNSMSLKVEAGDAEDFESIKGGFSGFGVRTGLTLGFGF